LAVCCGQLDEVVGVVRGRDLIADLILQGKIDMAHVRPALIMPEAAGVMRIMETLKRAHGQLVLIADEYGTIQGLVTPIDLLEAIAGEFPDEDEQPAVQAMGGDRWQVDGTADLIDLQQVLQTDALVSPDADYTSLGGFLLARFDCLPAAGDTLEVDGLQFEVATLRERRVATVLVTRMAMVAEPEDADAAGGR
jgi:CBS domain containing-hemolysin-like protein